VWAITRTPPTATVIMGFSGGVRAYCAELLLDNPA
jgi:hypothetical protein